MSKGENVKKMFNLLFDQFGTIDIPINNEEIRDKFVVEDIAYEKWKKLINAQ